MIIMIIIIIIINNRVVRVTTLKKCTTQKRNTRPKVFLFYQVAYNQHLQLSQSPGLPLPQLTLLSLLRNSTQQTASC